MINPRAWLTDVLTRLPECKQSELEELLPHKWKRTQNDESFALIINSLIVEIKINIDLLQTNLINEYYVFLLFCTLRNSKMLV